MQEMDVIGVTEENDVGGNYSINSRLNLRQYIVEVNYNVTFSVGATLSQYDKKLSHDSLHVSTIGLKKSLAISYKL